MGVNFSICYKQKRNFTLVPGVAGGGKDVASSLQEESLRTPVTTSQQQQVQSNEKGKRGCVNAVESSILASSPNTILGILYTYLVQYERDSHRRCDVTCWYCTWQLVPVPGVVQ